MSTARKIADNIRMDILGGQLTDQPTVELLQVYEKMNQARGTIYRNLITEGKFKEVDTDGLQNYYSVYDKTVQDNPTTYIRFAVPEIMSLPFNIGLGWVGRTDRVTDFRITNGAGAMSDVRKIKSLTPSALRPNCYYQSGYIYVFGDLNIRKILVNAYFNDPFEMPIYTSAEVTNRLYDEDLDEYPISEAFLPMLYQIVKESIVPPVVIDNKNDGILTTNQVENGVR